MSGNRLGAGSNGQLPGELGRCGALQELLLDGNELTDLPLELGLLDRLHTLRLDVPTLLSPPQVGSGFWVLGAGCGVRGAGFRV